MIHVSKLFEVVQTHKTFSIEWVNERGGELFHEDLQLAIDTVKGSKFANKRQLQEFGLL